VWCRHSSSTIFIYNSHCLYLHFIRNFRPNIYFLCGKKKGTENCSYTILRLLREKKKLLLCKTSWGKRHEKLSKRKLFLNTSKYNWNEIFTKLNLIWKVFSFETYVAFYKLLCAKFTRVAGKFVMWIKYFSV
jgi:hypothetical protein